MRPRLYNPGTYVQRPPWGLQCYRHIYVYSVVRPQIVGYPAKDPRITMWMYVYRMSRLAFAVSEDWEYSCGTWEMHMGCQGTRDPSSRVLLPILRNSHTGAELLKTVFRWYTAMPSGFPNLGHSNKVFSCHAHSTGAHIPALLFPLTPLLHL